MTADASSCNARHAEPVDIAIIGTAANNADPDTLGKRTFNVLGRRAVG
jgi:hypothetical protein